ncbi:MATE efflux family protein [Oceaniovalibus guishaninsula JLT2003]|uniref:Multidrug-efflux transporter n=1 Tax=Oceaniovalibus guishaninsula JLT2003 TaxID=1231392 RepID=K2I3H0_9RHOB|nr:MATE family efflux transporter [Oceaniovalibus guishaninsula]EKE43450.1 MATE efflux family protein [Oceaniovalibus guishaninsula JLT2003]
MTQTVHIEASPPIGQHVRRIAVLGLPLVGSHLAQFAIQLTDTIMLGWYDVTVLAGQVLGGTIFFVLFLMGSGFAWAVMPIVASAAASGQEREVRRVTRMAMWLVTIFAALAMPLFLFARPILVAMGQDPEVARLAALYLVIQGWSIFPALIVMVLKSYLAALERTQVVLWVTVASAAANALFNWVFIFGNLGAPELGIVGAALASLGSTLVAAIGLILYSWRATPEHAIFFRLWKFDGGAFARVFRLGWPIGLTSLAEVGLFAGSAVMIGWLGAVPLAAHGIAMQIISVLFMVQIGLSNVATIRAGNAYGRADGTDLRRGAAVVVALSLGFAAFSVVLLLSAPRLLIAAFLDPADPDLPQVMAIGVGLLAAAALFNVADSAQVVALGLLRGVQDTRVPMIVAAVSYWIVGMPLAYVLGFPLGLGGAGIWLGMGAGLGLAGAALSWRFWRQAAYAVENGQSG